jgi:hypothetical protein
MGILRVIGDLHGCINNRTRFQDLPSYVELCEELGKDDYSVQLGDCGFNYDDLNLVDGNRHRIVLGNHENYDTAFAYPHILGHYGVASLGPFSFFHIRGGFSLDKAYRVKHERLAGQKSYWPEEELNQQQGRDAVELYEQVRPDVVFSHDCPSSISFLIGNPEFVMAFGYPRDMISSTQHLLQQMLEIHAPKMWLFGHYHKNWEIKYRGCNFICVAERQFIDFDEQWQIVGKSGLERKGSTA